MNITYCNCYNLGTTCNHASLKSGKTAIIIYCLNCAIQWTVYESCDFGALQIILSEGKLQTWQPYLQDNLYGQTEPEMMMMIIIIIAFITYSSPILRHLNCIIVAFLVKGYNLL